MDLSKSTQDIYHEGSKKFSEIKRHIMRLLPFWIAGSATAIVATGYARLFEWSEHLSLQLFSKLGIWFLIVPPLFFVASWYLVERFAPRSNGSGIPQLMAAVELAHQKNDSVIDRLLSFRIIFVKIFSSLIGVVGGGSIGREGPTLQISGSLFHLFSKYWKFSEIQNRSAFLLAGAASGLASAFNTPLGGIVYVVEELAKSHLNTFRTGVLHAVICAGIISQMVMGSYLYLGSPKVSSFDFSLVLEYLSVALLAGIMVTAFAQTLKFIVRQRALLTSRRARFTVTLLAGLLFSYLIVFVSAKAMGPGKDLLNVLLFSEQTASLRDVFSRFAGSILTYANGGAGGIFAPTLSLGGSVGSFFSGLLDLNLGTLAVLMGMTSGLAALTHSPLTSFILILEMTDRHTAIFPLMLAAIVGHGISKIISAQSFYEFVSERIIHEYEKK